MVRKRAGTQAKRAKPRWLTTYRRYCDEVLDGRRTVCSAIVRAVQRAEEWRDKGRYEFRDEEVSRTLEFMSYLAHVRGGSAGATFTPTAWQLFAIANIFGWYRDDRRLTRRAFLSVARKNGKSTFAAALGLRLLMADREAGPQVMCVATSREQARIVFEEAALMIETSDKLRGLAYAYRNELRCPAIHGTMWAAGAEAAHLWGYSLSGAIIDELHAHRDRSLYDAIVTSMVARREPVLICVSTAGEDQAELFGELRDYTDAVTAGAVSDDEFFGLDFYVEDNDDWHEPASWQKANPSVGVTLSLDDLMTVYKASRTPMSEVTFRRYHLNQSVASSGSWIPLHIWRRTALASLPDLRGRRCFVGVDLASTTDLSAVVAVFPDDDGRAYVVHKAFTSQYAMTSGPRAKVYKRFAAANELVVTPGDVIDDNAVRAYILELTKTYDVQSIFYDPAFSGSIIQRLVSDGVPEHKLVQHPQYAKVFDQPLRNTERMIYEGKLFHLDSEILDFCIANAVTEANSFGSRRLSKKKSTGPIDLAVALVMAAGNIASYQQAKEVGIQWL